MVLRQPFYQSGWLWLGRSPSPCFVVGNSKKKRCFRKIWGERIAVLNKGPYARAMV